MNFEAFEFIKILLIVSTIGLSVYFVRTFKRSYYKKMKKFRFLFFKSRLRKVNNFEVISEKILFDILEALRHQHNSREQALALLPLLMDIRKIGEKLLKQQYFYHTFLFPVGESQLRPRIERLIHVEKLLKSLPKESFSNDKSESDYMEHRG